MNNPDERAHYRSASEWLAEAKEEERKGELFRAFDLAVQGLDQHPGDLPLKYCAVLSLASTGATQQAKAKFKELGLDAVSNAPRGEISRGLIMSIATLQARLVKDEALKRTGDVRRALLTMSADLYEAAYRDHANAGHRQAYYPAINAATLHLLTDDRAGALQWARTALGELGKIPSDRHGYFELVTAAEAHLLQGDVEQARAHTLRACASKDWTSEADYRALASTIRQLQLVTEAKALDGDWLKDIAPPRVIHYVGHIIAAPGQFGRFPSGHEETIRREIDNAFGGAKIGAGYGSLASGADILFAEALLRHKASLHVVLPFDEEEFVDVSVRPAGPDWVERYWTCRRSAQSVRFATEGRYLGHDWLFGYCSKLAMGLALLRARHLCSEAEQFAVWDGRLPEDPVGTAADIAAWQQIRKPQTIIRCMGDEIVSVASTSDPPDQGRVLRAMLFGDLIRFSRLSDADLPRYTEVVFGALAGVIGRYRSDVLFTNTWGDGLFLVFANAGVAADCALNLQEAIATTDFSAADLPVRVGLRIGVHLGPVYVGYDPILGHESYFGAHVNRAARIEPVTPEGCIYVTETMAAFLEVESSERFVCDYVGYTTAAKNYGRMRMFLLRRATALQA
jgi:class 3 adenylate cyclase